MSEDSKALGQEWSMLVGNLVSICSGGVICILVSLCTQPAGRILSQEWEKTQAIDNPLFPWTELYAKELGLSENSGDRQSLRPSYEAVAGAFKGAKITACVASILLTIVLIVIWPLIMLRIGILDRQGFEGWVMFSEAWAWVAGAFVIIIPIIWEIRAIRADRAVVKATVQDDSVTDFDYEGPKWAFRTITPDPIKFRPTVLH
ncbi:unnamed protein product [Darwinula stevensoni]|uniref:Uncharacterized protein n=1 Tax=Darwinula stevensoni TaxID=69355 RepID=A0A7R9AFD6_9CRUS|nr:unnamed protein product [Darwinula stevensoni]CAG0903177.1 unnamed protein product [Darwinula stevensoni]